VRQDLIWNENGQCALGGPLLVLEKKLDEAFLEIASKYKAVEYRFPAVIAASELQKIDYFHSFPHLLTFPISLDRESKNLKEFADSDAVASSGEVCLKKLSPVKGVLTPAACYHFYTMLKDQELTAPRFLTTRAICFRCEEAYEPLKRQWNFSMREIVCLGNADEVKKFLESCRKDVENILKKLDLACEFKPATDPFFNPSRNPKYLSQKLDPVKTEMVFQDLAIGSINFHRNYFGEAFKINREGKDCFSGCVAFGIERWIHAVLTRYGADEKKWPDLTKF